MSYVLEDFHGDTIFLLGGNAMGSKKSRRSCDAERSIEGANPLERIRTENRPGTVQNISLKREGNTCGLADGGDVKGVNAQTCQGGGVIICT